MNVFQKLNALEGTHPNQAKRIRHHMERTIENLEYSHTAGEIGWTDFNNYRREVITDARLEIDNVLAG